MSSGEAKIRREPILAYMRDLSAQRLNCNACRGECCTSKSNSMQICDDEADDILDDLRARGLLTAELIETIKQTIADYRLDVETPSHGARPNLRRSYTCPLYLGGNKGCMVSPEKKPLGCLAFNPVRPGSTGLQSGCRSNQQLLSDCTPVQPKAPIPVMLWRRLK